MFFNSYLLTERFFVSKIKNLIMAINNQVYTVMVPAASANFTAHTYSCIYASAAATPTVNGVAIALAAGSSVNLLVRSISSGTNCYLLGDNIDVSGGPVYLNS